MKGPKNKPTIRTGGPAIPGVNVKQLEQLLDFMAAHDLEEFEYEHDGLHIRLKKASTASDAPSSGLALPKKNVRTRVVPTTEDSEADDTSPEPAAAAASEEFHIIKSPIVGTFYAASSPEAPPFIKVGDTVRIGQVACIIEAMKLMNEIEADIGGQVARVLVENGQPVEYGQSLFAIRPEKK